MVTKNDIERLDFTSLEEYFQYIMDSKINGQPKQVRELFKKLSKPQKREFLCWFDNEYFFTETSHNRKHEHHIEYTWYVNLILK